jgi:methyl-accepting chemotaxis protein
VKKWNDLKLGMKLIAIFSIVIGMGFIVGIIGLNSLTRAGDNADIIRKSDSLVINILEARRSEKNYILRGDAKYIDEVKGY